MVRSLAGSSMTRWACTGKSSSRSTLSRRWLTERCSWPEDAQVRGLGEGAPHRGNAQGCRHARWCRGLLFVARFFEGLLPVPYLGYGIGGALFIVVGVLTKFSMGSVLLFILFIAHALVGAVELGTDGWIQNITGNIFSSEAGKWLFIWTSTIMFALRFCAHWIETKLKLSPVGLLFVCAVLACVGLLMSSTMTTLVVAFGALGLYAIGRPSSGPPCWPWPRTASRAPAPSPFRSWAVSA